MVPLVVERHVRTCRDAACEVLQAFQQVGFGFDVGGFGDQFLGLGDRVDQWLRVHALETRTRSSNSQYIDRVGTYMESPRYPPRVSAPVSAGRASPPTERVVRILDFLAGRPEQRFGLSDLARRLELSKPTCLGIVTSLTDAGYLVRDAGDKTYRLGPSLITLGHKAQESMRVSPAAREELRRLSARFGVTAALSGVIDDRITLLDLVAPAGARPGVEVGQSYPFAPPVGLMFVLWDDEAERDWLAKEPTIPLRTNSDRLNRVIAVCRADGYLVERLTTGRAAAVFVDGGHVEQPARRVARAAWRVGV